MTCDPIRAALAAAAKRLCVCDGECFETRHGKMLEHYGRFGWLDDPSMSYWWPV